MLLNVPVYFWIKPGQTFSFLFQTSWIKCFTDVDPDQGKVYPRLGVLLLHLDPTFMLWSKEEKAGLFGSSL